MTEFQQFQELTLPMWINLNSEGNYDSVRSPNVFKHGYRNDSNGIYCEVQDSAGTTFTVRSGSSLNTGEWYHSTLYYNQSELRVYVNGVLKGTTVANGNALFDGDSGFSIGESDGILDDVRFYERALKQWEIHEVYRFGTLGKDLRGDLVSQR